MKIRSFLAGILAAAASLAPAAVTEADWCTVTTPDSFKSGERFQIQVKMKKDLPEGQNLNCHLHWMKKDRWGGMGGWHPAREPKNGETAVFNFTVDTEKFDGFDRLHPLVFIAPGGDFAKATTKIENLPDFHDVITAEEIAARKREAERIRKPDTVTFKKSWIRINPVSKPVVRSGEEFEYTVDYYVDPSDNWADGTKLQFMPLGPWIDNPDGAYNKNRHHEGVYGLRTSEIPAVVGQETTVTFKMKIAKTREYDEFAVRAKFRGGDGKEWPWEIRGGGPVILADNNDFQLNCPAPGGLYFYDEPVKVDFTWAGKLPAGAGGDVSFAVFDTEGRKVAEFTQAVPAEAGATTAVQMPAIGQRGVFLLTAKLGDIERYTYFGRVPDVRKALGGKKSPFNCTQSGYITREQAEVAGKLGFTHWRIFTSWNTLESQPDHWTLGWISDSVDHCNEFGVQPWIALTAPPDWVMPAGVHNPGFAPFPLDEFGERHWSEAVEKLATTFKGRIYGFEWLNEIVPGNFCKDPTAEYLRFCEIGTTIARRIAPEMKIQLAGGLWPRSYRMDLIRAGIGKYVDILPVHYSGHDGVQEAGADAAAGGIPEVIDNETAQGMSVWNMPALEKLTYSATRSSDNCPDSQCRWILRQWPGELVAGATQITYFGGWSNAAGNWGYLLNDHTPRPVAATLAVAVAKLGTAVPVGAVYLDPGAVVYVFQNDKGEGLAVLYSVSRAEGAAIALPVGKTTRIRMTDYQGNESELAAADGALSIRAEPMPVILEGLDIAPLAARASLTLAGQNPLAPAPSVRLVAGSTPKVQAVLKNPLRAAVSGSLSVEIAGVSLGREEFSMKPGETKFLTFQAPAPNNDATAGKAVLVWTDPATVFEKPFAVEVVRPELLGNLLKNPGMEEPGAGGGIADWGGNAVRADLGGTAPGLRGHAMEIADATSWKSSGQAVRVPAPGKTYLYSAWYWTSDMSAGSNVFLTDDKGQTKTLTMPSVFTAPVNTPSWIYLTKQLPTDPSVVSVNFSPVCINVKPGAKVLVDNVRVTVSDGSDYAAEAKLAASAPAVDGDLSDWNLDEPVPLLCMNQVVADKGYEWTPANLAGEAFFTWDKDNLYVAARVQDDKHVALTDADTAKGDSLTVALHPGNRVPGTDGQAVEWNLSSAAPGGGSGKCTLYRPEAHSAGLKAGQLARDSSVYGVAVKTEGTITTYELRVPWSEVGAGFIPEMGTKLGLSLRLVDNDGTAAGAAMTWGMGLYPGWAPSAFGVLTLVK